MDTLPHLSTGGGCFHHYRMSTGQHCCRAQVSLCIFMCHPQQQLLFPNLCLNLICQVTHLGQGFVSVLGSLGCHNKMPQTKNLLLIVLVRGKAKITMPMGPVSGEGFLLGLQMATPCCVFTARPFGGVQVEREEASSWVSLFSQGNKSHHECSILTTSSKPPKDPQLQIPSHEVGASTREF